MLRERRTLIEPSELSMSIWKDSTEKKMTYEERQQSVHDWQRFYNMDPRQDSRLTDLFCKNSLPAEWTAKTVARELMATDFIYKNTLYGELIEDFMRAVALRLRERHSITWKATWDIVRFYAPTALKLLCLEQTGTVIPPHLPSCVEPCEQPL